MRKFEYKGVMLSITELMPFCEVSRSVLSDRLIKLGWIVNAALTRKTEKQESKNNPSKHTVDSDISAHNLRSDKKRKEIGMFAQCVRRTNAK